MTNIAKIILEGIKNYQRPVRTCLWAILIAVAFIMCLAGKFECNGNTMAEYILIGMFTDMGIYTAARSIEKTKNIIDKNQINN